MNFLLWYDGKRFCRSIETNDTDAAEDIAVALEKEGWKVVWTVHSTDSVRPFRGYEKALEEWKKFRDA